MFEDIKITNLNENQIVLRNENIFEKASGFKLYTPTVLLTGKH
jgi:hypothetical protein